jgi:D-alanine-D-alanine ligase
MSPDRLRVAVLMGGPSSEHDVSISSGLQVLAALDAARYEGVPVYLRRDGEWEVGRPPERASLDASSDGSAPGHRESRRSVAGLARGLSALAETRPDVAFLAMHGAFGEDGTIQGLLSMAGIPFTGSGVLASALAMDKLRAKEIFAAAQVPVAAHALATRADLVRDRDALLRRVLASPGLPCVVKPVASGSSVATHLVGTEAALLPAIEDALRVDERALVERRLRGTEVTCGVLGGGPHEEATALPLTEICPAGEFFDFRAKYTKGASEDITPARVDAATTARVQQLALAAHAALGCEGMSRTDFIIENGLPHALETNTIPGMTPLSLLPQEAAAAGIAFPQLLDRLVRSALLRAGRA